MCPLVSLFVRLPVNVYFCFFCLNVCLFLCLWICLFVRHLPVTSIMFSRCSYCYNKFQFCNIFIIFNSNHPSYFIYPHPSTYTGKLFEVSVHHVILFGSIKSNLLFLIVLMLSLAIAIVTDICLHFFIWHFLIMMARGKVMRCRPFCRPFWVIV